MLDKTKTLQPTYGGIVPFAEIVPKEGKTIGLGHDSYHSLREGNLNTDLVLKSCNNSSSVFPSYFFLCLLTVLQLKLQQRRTREELVSQGIMPRKCNLCKLLLPLLIPSIFIEMRSGFEIIYL
ncbi:hypothetical protein JD844_028290 [Phrynosoma platyrhinos]|uniref:Phosphatase and actin regulator n=1 Tax=Phrynosoma platyrhinos TaxID=52577 RepID=A0ABQ7SI03_PHRPL|nr:hypothetical protein JD844_028290 [Phrynosoma platyrhinos]